MLVLSRGNSRTVQDFKWSSRLSFFRPLLDHDVVTIHLNALDTSPVGLSCLLIWPCFFGPVVLSKDWTCRTFPNRRGCIGPFPKVAWRDWTCLAPFSLASLHRSQRCLSPFTWVPWDSFPEQGSLTLATASFVNFELRAAVGLGMVRHSSHVLYQSLGTWGTPCADLLVVLHTAQNLCGALDRVPLATFGLFLFCPVDVWHNTRSCPLPFFMETGLQNLVAQIGLWTRTGTPKTMIHLRC